MTRFANRAKGGAGGEVADIAAHRPRPARTGRPHPSVPGWTAGGEFTVGAEDELLLVDPEAQLLGPAAISALASFRQQAPADGRVDGEVFVDEVELGTPVCADAEELMRSLRVLRRSLSVEGVHPMGVGVHPTAGVGSAAIATSPRYKRIGDEFAGLLRTPTAAFQVHVGVPDPDSAVLAYRGLRNRLSIFRALAAGSPYWHGRDSGLACARAGIIRSYPRTTMPPALESWDRYLETIEKSMWVSEVPDYTYVCWELRPQPRLGTVEIRVMDAQHSITRAAGLTALVQGVARHAVEEPDPRDLPDEVVIANDFQACRHGLDATILDHQGSRLPIRAVIARALEDASSALASDGLDGPLDVIRSMLIDPPEYQRQRELCQQQGMPSLLADLVVRTMSLDT